MTLQVQFLTMISMIVGGFYLGIARDTYLRFSPYWKQRVSLRYLFEITFWMSQSFLLFYILYQVNAGELRAYVFVACILGLSMYKVIFASLYKELLELVIRILLMTYRFFKKLFHVFVIVPINGVIYLVSLILQLFFTILFFLIKCIFIPFSWLVKLVFSLLPKKFQKIIRKLIEFYSIIKNTSIKWIKNILLKRR